MKNGNVIQEKSYAFALQVVKLYRHLVDITNWEYVTAITNGKQP